MARRAIIYDQEQIDPFDILWQFKDTITAIGLLETDLTGQTTTMVSGLAATPTAPASLSINIGAGRVYQQGPIDSTSYGSLPVDNTVIQQQGRAAAQVVALSTVGLGAGQGMWALIQVSFEPLDSVRTGDPTGGVLNYFNTNNPNQWFQGPNGDGQSQPTQRDAVANISVIYGAIATSGTEVPPNPSAGCVPLYLVDLTFGQTTVQANQILTAGPSVAANVPNNYPYAPLLAGLLNAHHNGQPGQAPKINLATEVQGQLPIANQAAANGRIVTVTTTLQVLSTDYSICLDRSGTLPANQTVNLPTVAQGLIVNQEFEFYDANSNADTCPLLLTLPAGHTFGARGSEISFNVPNGRIKLKYFGGVSNLWGAG